MSGKKKTGLILSIVLPVAGLMTVGIIVLGVILLGRLGDAVRKGSAPETELQLDGDVELCESPRELQRRYERIEEENGVYTVVYRERLPEFFEELSVGDLFCVPADERADRALFAGGFSGRLVSKTVRGDEAKVCFTVPDITQLLPELDLSLGDPGLRPDSVLFVPGEGGFESGISVPGASLTALSPAALAALKFKESDTAFSMKEGDGVSLLDGYAYVCEELKLKTKTVTEVGPLELELDSRVILEDLGIRTDVSYYTDEATGEVVVENCDIGIVSKHRLDMTVKPSVSAGLDDVGGDFAVIDFKDATDAEDGKIVLGTFLVGFSVPFLESEANKVSYLSLGIAIQLTLTAEGEISMECRYEQSGYSRIEADSEGNVVEEIRGYDFPNPLVDSSAPTREQLESSPEMKCSVSGEIRLHAGLGIDAGLCIFGTVPVKISNNIVDVVYYRSGRLMELGGDDPMDRRIPAYENGYMLDDYAELFKVSVTSFLRINIGLESDLDVLNMTSFDIGAEAQLFNRVLYQYPDPVGFTREQCDFGGIRLGESYTSEELTAAFREFQRDTKQSSIIGNVKDMAVNSAITGFVEGLDPERLSGVPEFEWDELFGNVNVAVFSSGALYITDGSGTVVCELITGEGIVNSSGLGCGANKLRTEMIYSVPDQQESAHIELGEYLEDEILAFFPDFREGEITLYGYDSRDSDDVMLLVYVNDGLKLIAVVNEGFLDTVV